MLSYPSYSAGQRAIAVGSSHLVVRFKLFAKIALPEKQSL